ncbi:TRAP transporter small permease [Corynebacterium tapiri]|uniref:TRAP transporter small permease n=1 Tax=Corynebacterium tapiri TaxID=1448266 RepID=A0A5C4U677_9CORY|nr:TRAP transporter small permease [Corynebacterium tapiri]
MRKALKNILAVTSITLFGLLVCITVWQVIARQLIGQPSTWSEEAAKLLFVWLSFLGSAFLFGERGHIAVDYLARRLPQKLTTVFVQLIILIFAMVGMVWGGIVAAGNAWDQNLTALPLTIGWAYVVIPISGAFIAAFALLDMVKGE